MTDENMPSVFEFSTDINDAKPPSPLPVGEYRGSVITAVGQKSKNSGNRMGVFTHRITPDQYPVDFADGDPEGVSLITYRVMENAPKYLYMVKQMCADYGVPIRRTPDGGSKIELSDFIGQDVLITVEHEEYQGQVRAKASRVRPV